jgi:hypothetical protein
MKCLERGHKIIKYKTKRDALNLGPPKNYISQRGGANLSGYPRTDVGYPYVLGMFDRL